MRYLALFLCQDFQPVAPVAPDFQKSVSSYIYLLTKVLRREGSSLFTTSKYRGGGYISPDATLRALVYSPHQSIEDFIYYIKV